MKMLDYVKLANSRLRENLIRADSLTGTLTKTFTDGSFDSVRIIASGSSRHSADCARDFMQDVLNRQVVVVTPETYIAHEHRFPSKAFSIVISQSGFSTNSIAALDYMRDHGDTAIVLTGNPEAPIAHHADIVIDYGVGVESIDFVTMGVVTLIEFLMLFAIDAARASKTIDNTRAELEHKNLAATIEAHKQALKTCEKLMSYERLILSRRSPVCIIGNGPNYGVAEEGALKLNECNKLPAMYSEGEEFVHGPHMQLTPDSLVFIIDDAKGSSRLANLHMQFRTVTAGAFLITGHPRSMDGEVYIPATPNPLMCAIPNLVVFQYLAAQKTEELELWKMHPYVRAMRNEIATKAEGYEDSLRQLDRRAQETYGD